MKMRKVIAVLLCAVMVLSGFSAFAEYPTYNYTPGLFEYSIELDGDIVGSENVSFDGTNLVMEANGKVSYEYTLPFDAAKLTIKYDAAENVNLTMTTPDNEYAFELKSEEKEVTYDLSIEHSGETLFTFEADKAVKISDLKFTKKETSLQGNDYETTGMTVWEDVVEYTPYQKAVNTAFILMEGSTGIKVRNLTRYIDLDNTSETIKMYNDRMYLPVETLARGLSLYYEDRPEDKYIYLSGDSFALWQKDGAGYYEKAAKKEDVSIPVEYINGKTYVPLRAISELAGKVVLYKDGIAVVDTKLAANNIINNDEVMAQIKAELGAYIPEYSGKTYYVAQTENASDDNDGSEAAPFATIQKAADIAVAGDTVIIREGVYREKVVVKNQGTAGNPIVFKAADGENVTISAFEKVSGFEPYTNPANGIEMYKTSLEDLTFECLVENGWDVDRNFVLYNGDILVEGRHPNETTSTKSTVIRFNEKLDKETNPTQTEEFTREVATGLNPSYPDKDTHKLLPTYGDMRIHDMQLKDDQAVREKNYKVYNHRVVSDVDFTEETPDYWKGAIFVTAAGYNWQLSAAQITSSKKGEAIASEYWRGDSGSITYNVNKYAHDYGYLTHHLNTVDKAGEWYIDNKAKEMYIIPPAGVSGEELEVEVKNRQVVLNLDDREYVQIQNINTRGGGLAMNNATGCIFNGGTHKYISQFDIAGQYNYSLIYMYMRWDVLKGGPAVEGGDQVTDTHTSGEAGFSINGIYNVIRNTDIEYSSGAGIYVTGSYNLVENNVIDKTGYGVTYPCGINVGGSASTTKEGYPWGGHQIYQNTVSAAGRACLQMTGVKSAPAEVAFNELAYGCLNSRDTGAWYQYGFVGGDDLTKSQFHHNFLHDVAGPMDDSILTTLFYNDGYTGIYDVYDNFYYNSTDDPAFQARYTFNHGTPLCAQDEWSNYTFNFPSAEAVKFDVADYPGSYPYQAGARLEGAPAFNDNFNKDRENYVVNLANEKLEGGSYVNEDGFVILPEKDSSVTVDNVNISDKGSKINIYYASDKYGMTVDNLPVVWMEMFDADGNSLGTVSTTLFAHAAHTDKISRGIAYVSKDYKDATSMKITTGNHEIKFATLAIDEFDYDTENAKREISFDAQVLPMGSFARIDDDPECEWGTGVPYPNLTEAAGENLTYWSVGQTRNFGFYYKDFKIGKNCDEILFSGSSNATYSKSKISIYLGTDATGEKIGEIDCSNEWPTGKAWHQRYVNGDLFKNIEPGTYDIYVKFDNTDDSLGEFGMSFNGGAIVFY